IISGSYDKTVQLWDVVSGQCLSTIQTIDSTILSMAWSTTPDVNCFVIGCDDGSVHMWRVVEDEGTRSLRPRWRPVKGELVVKDASIQGVNGLSQADEQLLKQRGAVGVPLVRLHEATKKVIGMASVVSTLKKASGKSSQDPPSSYSPSIEQPGQQEGREIDT
ncbi:hypothetical protein BGX34_004554, partial [Mortierella sp. NVP85]